MQSGRIAQLEQRAMLPGTGRVVEARRRRAEGGATAMGVSMVYDRV
jgi:hypothetical protein